MMGYSQISSISNKESQAKDSEAVPVRNHQSADFNGVLSSKQVTEQVSHLDSKKTTQQNSSTVVQEEQKGSPVFKQEQNGSPVIEGLQNSILVVKEEKSGIPVVKEEQNDIPIVKEEKSGIPVVKEEKSGIPVVKEEQIGITVVKEEAAKGVVSKLPVHIQDGTEPAQIEAPEFPLETPTERKQSQSSNSSGSSAKDSPSKVPPPTPPKANKSPQNQGKMPTCRADGIFGDDIEMTQLPGYQSVPDGCPGWKKAMIEKKNSQLLDEARREILVKKAEEEKWRDVPEWKRSLILEKERKKKEENEPIEVQRKRLEEEENRIKSMPNWKKNLVLKKKD